MKVQLATIALLLGASCAPEPEPIAWCYYRDGHETQCMTDREMCFAVERECWPLREEIEVTDTFIISHVVFKKDR